MSIGSVLSTVGNALFTGVQAAGGGSVLGGLGNIGSIFGIKELSRLGRKPAAAATAAPVIAAPGGNGGGGTAQQAIRAMLSEGGRRIMAGARVAMDRGAGSRFAEFEAREEAGGSPFDVIGRTQADDLAVRDLLISRGVVPLASDVGHAAQLAGGRVKSIRVRFEDGTSAPMMVVELVRRRKRKNYNTPARRRDAARVLRAVKRDLTHAKRLHRAAQGLVPRKASACVPVRKTTCRKR